MPTNWSTWWGQRIPLIELFSQLCGGHLNLPIWKNCTELNIDTYIHKWVCVKLVKYEIRLKEFININFLVVILYCNLIRYYLGWRVYWIISYNYKINYNLIIVNVQLFKKKNLIQNFFGINMVALYFTINPKLYKI